MFKTKHKNCMSRGKHAADDGLKIGNVYIRTILEIIFLIFVIIVMVYGFYIAIEKSKVSQETNKNEEKNIISENMNEISDEKTTDLEEVVNEAEDNNDKDDSDEAEEVEITIKAKKDCNIRKEDTTDSEKLGTLKKDEKVKATKKTKNGWYKIEYKNSEAYVKASLVEEVEI